MSFPIPTTDVPPARISKNSDVIDDSMVCNDENWTVSNVDSNHKKNNTREIKNKSTKEKIPPKSDTSTCAPLKSKKRKLSSSDELIDNIHSLDYVVLSTNLTKLLFFLESDYEECPFPFTSKEYEAFFEIIVQDVNILKSKSLNTDYGYISDKIIEAAACNSLFYEFENRSGYETRVMVIKKLPKMDQSENSPPSASRITATEIPPSNRPRDSDPNAQSCSSIPVISSGFKIHCLRALVAFIKNKTMNTKEFPELNADQAKFMHLLLGKVSVCDFDGSTEVKELYTTFVQAVQMYRMQFEFKIQCVESWGGKKTVVFEKVPKPMFSETIDDSNEMAVDSVQTMNPKADPSNSQAPNMSVVPNIDTSKSYALKEEIPKTNAPELQGPTTDAAFPQGPKTDTPNSQNPKINVPEKTASESQGPKTYAQASKIEVPKSQFPETKPDEKSKFDKLKYEMDMLLIKKTPRQFISVTLNNILNFLLDWNSKQKKLVFVPNNQAELEFYRKCIDWCRSGTELCMFAEEFRDLQCRISRLMTRFNIEATKKTANPLNKITGIREVSYVKTIKVIPRPPSVETMKQAERFESQSSPRKPKVNVKKTLELAVTELESVINLHQSILRSKKKDKKLKKAELKRANNRCASKEESVKPAKMNNGPNTSDNSMDKERTQSAAKRPSSEISQSPRPTASRRPTGFRKEQLIEALSVPVQSEIAMRMMVGMGWSGGALGARGDGITEPLMPALEIGSRAGLGLASHKAQKQASNQNHKTSNPFKVPKKTKESKSSPSLKSGSDTAVDRTKELQHGNSIFDATTKITEPKTNEFPKPSTSKFQSTSAWTSNVELPKLTTSKLKPLKSNAKPPPTQTRYNIELQETGNVPIIRLPFRQEILQSVWELLNSDQSCITLKYDKPLNKKQKKFINLGLKGLKARNACYIYDPSEVEIYTQIRQKYAENPEIVIDARCYFDFKSIDLLKLPTQGYAPSQLPEKVKPNFDMKLTEENIHSYILTTNGACDSAKQFEVLKFRVLFLFNVLNFVKSLNEEVEILFNKVLAKRQLIYMENVIDEVNMRIKFGSTRAEVLLGEQIREHVKDAFLGLMCDHQFMIATISKYYRFKRLNRPDNAVRRKSQTAVNLDDFTCETVAKTNAGEVKREPKIKFEFNDDVIEVTYEMPQDKYEIHENTAEPSTNVSDDGASEALPIINELEPYDSDESSIEEYIHNNANTTVPKPLSGEEVNISNFLYLYDKEKANTASTEKYSIINNNDSASKLIGNRNNKNNFGNGNVVIDNNDNQFIDMKRQGGDTKRKDILDWAMADYDDECFDYNEEEEFMNPVTSIDNNERIITGKAALKPPNLIIASDNVEIGEDFDNKDVILVEDSDSDNDCPKDINKQEISDIKNPPPQESKEDVIMKDVDADKTIEIIDITENSMEGIDGDESKHAIKQEELMVVIKSSEIKEEIEKDESTTVINQVESSEDIKVKKETSISPSNVQIAEDGLEIKTDCDKIKKENIDLSVKDICDTCPVDSSHQNTRTDLLYDKNSEIRHVRIEHTHHPIIKLSLEKVKKIQRHIANSIGRDVEIPLLKCHGPQNGVLFYSCHNKKSYDWLQRTISDASFAKVCDNNVVPTKMLLKMFCCFDFDSLYLFNMLEVCNKGISTKDWVVEKTEKNGDYIFFNVNMDEFSIKFIQKSNFELCAGVNKAEFILVWE